MRKGFKVVVAALAVSLLAATPLGQKMDMSSVAYAYASNENAEMDPKSGLIKYWDSNLRKWGYTDSNGNIVIPAQWGRAGRFCAGYAMVVDDIRGEHISDNIYRAQYRIINESGQTVGAFTSTGDWTQGREGYMGEKRQPYRFGENDKGLFGYEEYQEADTNALLYVKYYIDGNIEYIEFPQFVNKTENNIFTRYNIGTFRNGTANIYELTGTYRLSMTGDGNWHKERAIASITVDGMVLDEINPDSKWLRGSKDKLFPDYGVNQFASGSDPIVKDSVEGWNQDSTGWWYQNADGSYPVNQWREVNGKQYYFGADGYMLADTTTPDGYSVGTDGAWIE